MRGILLRCMSPEVALNVGFRRAAIETLWERKRTCVVLAQTYEDDPYRPFATVNCRIAKGSFALDVGCLGQSNLNPSYLVVPSTRTPYSFNGVSEVVRLLGGVS
jgi:hypothetical protein